MLKLDSVNVAYGDIQVLWDISFEAKAGEIVSIVGANGAGKTTTVRTSSDLCFLLCRYSLNLFGIHTPCYFAIV